MSKKTAVFIKSTKLNGELVRAGQEIEVSDSDYKKLLESGVINNPDSVKEIKVSNSKELEDENKKLKDEINSLNEIVSTVEDENAFLKRVIALDKMTVKALNEFAETNKINLDGKTDKDDIVKIIALTDVEIETKTNFLG